MLSVMGIVGTPVDTLIHTKQNIVFTRKSYWKAQDGKGNVKTYNRYINKNELSFSELLSNSTFTRNAHRDKFR